ncbi:MAG TPA: DEAD/DEAH box helicase [Gemmatimonadales bacterium]|nr:DEAD/DEAH box helicase [Gemmatimonadales bacterium]
MTFDSLGLRPELLRALDAEGYEEPTPIQRETIPLALQGRDIVGSAQTGTGKTAAFVLPILQRLAAGHDESGHVVRALILVPTRELAEQVLERTTAYGQFLRGLSAAAVYGGVRFDPQTRALSGGADIIVATPGRLLDHMRRGHVDFSHVEALVLDEADRMLDMGFAPDVYRIIDALPRDRQRQTFLFSATISIDVDSLARRAMAGHASVEIGRRAAPAEGIEHGVIPVDKAHKREALARLLSVRPEGRALIFTRTKWGADALARYLARDGVPARAIHGDYAQAQRTKTLDNFRSGDLEVLVATDVAARGIDVENITLVVNFDVPNDPEIYVHRTGRTARAGALGLALTLMSPDEWLLVADIEKFVGRSFPRETVPGLEPSVEPPPFRTAVPEAPRPERSIRIRRGLRRR